MQSNKNTVGGSCQNFLIVSSAVISFQLSVSDPMMSLTDFELFSDIGDNSLEVPSQVSFDELFVNMDALPDMNGFDCVLCFQSLQDTNFDTYSHKVRLIEEPRDQRTRNNNHGPIERRHLNERSPILAILNKMSTRMQHGR